MVDKIVVKSVEVLGNISIIYSHDYILFRECKIYYDKKRQSLHFIENTYFDENINKNILNMSHHEEIDTSVLHKQSDQCTLNITTENQEEFLEFIAAKNSIITVTCTKRPHIRISVSDQSAIYIIPRIKYVIGYVGGQSLLALSTNFNLSVLKVEHGSAVLIKHKFSTLQSIQTGISLMKELSKMPSTKNVFQWMISNPEDHLKQNTDIKQLAIFRSDNFKCIQDYEIADLSNASNELVLTDHISHNTEEIKSKDVITKEMTTKEEESDKKYAKNIYQLLFTIHTPITEDIVTYLSKAEKSTLTWGNLLDKIDSCTLI